MAVTKAKRSVRNKQSAVSTQSTAGWDLQHSAKPKFANHQSKTTYQKLTHFLETKGRIVEDVQFFTGPSYNCLELRFQDNTTLTIEIQPSFVLAAYFSRWKSGNQSVLRRWPPVSSQLV